MKQSRASRPSASRRRPVVSRGLAEALLRTVIPANLILVLPTCLALVLLYQSAQIGGKAWVKASRQGALPITFSVLQTEGEACLREQLGLADQRCTMLRPASNGPDEESSALLRTEEPVLFIPRLGDAPAELRWDARRNISVQELLRLRARQQFVSGFVAYGEWVAHIVYDPATDGLLVRDVTTNLLERLVAVSAAEVELIDARTGEPIISSWRGEDGAMLRVEGKKIEKGDREVRLSAPYGGYQAAGEEADRPRFSRGKRAFATFAAQGLVPTLPEFAAVRAIISVPADVMTYYTNIAILMFAVLTLLLQVGLIVVLRRLARQHLAPVMQLARRVEKIRYEFQDEFHSPVTRSTLRPTAAVEIVHLGEAIDRLERQWEENQRLSESLARERLEAEEATQRSLREKIVLLKEIHHRVKNNLQIISSLLMLQSDQLDDDTSKQALVESVHRVRSMALIHQQLYGISSLDQIQLAEYAREMAAYLGSSLAPSVQIVVDADDVAVPVDRAVPFGLILNELVTNALKYGRAEPGVGSRLQAPNGETCDVCIEIRRTGDVVRLQVTDAGPGLPKDFDPRHAQSLGLELVRSLTRQLRAQLNVTNTPGACFLLQIPYEDAKPETQDPLGRQDSPQAAG